MRGSILGSGLVHLALLVVLLVVRASSPIVIPGPDVVQVALVDAPMTSMPVVPAPPPKPEIEAGEIAPTEDEGVKLEKPKKKPEEKKPVEKQPDPPPSTNVTAALPSARVGSAGLKGEIALDAGDFEFTYYLILVRNRIAGNWSPPAGLAASSNCRTVVYFKIARNGQITDVQIEKPSGVEFFDRSTTRAVTLSNPMPPLPLGYTGSRLGVHFGFEYSGP